MPDSIRVTGIEVFARHGVRSDEKLDGQTFFVDLDVTLDLGEAGEADRLESTIDYGELSQRTHDLVARTNFDLIEKVANEVAKMVLEYPRVSAVEVTVHKPQAPIPVGFHDVSVTIRRP